MMQGGLELLAVTRILRCFEIMEYASSRQFEAMALMRALRFLRGKAPF